MSILSQIVASKKLEIETLKKLHPNLPNESEILKNQKINFLEFEEFLLIAEIKAKSPSSGIIREDFDPIKLAQDFEKKAKAISVLTDQTYFGGNLELFAQARNSTNLPLLRKDFIIDSFQVWETKKSGADIILLIVRILEKEQFSQLLRLSLKLNLQVLVEIFDQKELETALREIDKIDKKVLQKNQIIFGVNNRNLETFETKLENCVNLANFIPNGFPKLALSGIKNTKDLEIVKKADYNGVLIGEGLAKNSELFEFFN